MARQTFSFLRSISEDAGFHTKRIMFWIVNGEVITAPIGTPMSHLEMAEMKGWIRENNIEAFFNNNSRGFYLKGENRVHFYRGVGFGFDEELEREIIEKLPFIVAKLNLEETTKVYFGPKDNLIKGIECPIKYVGEIGEISK